MNDLQRRSADIPVRSNLRFVALILLAVAAPGSSAFADQKADPRGRSAHTSGSRLYERDQWFYKQRAYPLDRVPEHSRLRAFQQIQQGTPKQLSLSALPPAAAVQGNNWVNIGPAPIQNGQVAPPQPVSGRVTGMAIDPLDNTHW